MESYLEKSIFKRERIKKKRKTDKNGRKGKKKEGKNLYI